MRKVYILFRDGEIYKIFSSKEQADKYLWSIDESEALELDGPEEYTVTQ